MAKPWFSPRHRDLRLKRADLVLRCYRISKVREQGQVHTYQVEGGQEPYLVQVAMDGSIPPTCTCPDASDPRGIAAKGVMGFCKHVIAVLRHAGLEGQLLPLLFR